VILGISIYCHYQCWLGHQLHLFIAILNLSLHHFSSLVDSFFLSRGVTKLMLNTFSPHILRIYLLQLLFLLQMFIFLFPLSFPFLPIYPNRSGWNFTQAFCHYEWWTWKLSGSALIKDDYTPYLLKNLTIQNSSYAQVISNDIHFHTSCPRSRVHLENLTGISYSRILHQLWMMKTDYCVHKSPMVTISDTINPDSFRFSYFTNTSKSEEEKKEL